MPRKPRTSGESRSHEPRAQAEKQEPRAQAEKSAKPRRERSPRKPKPVDTWKLEDFAVEPQEGKTRFHDFKLDPRLMHGIHDLGFPYCTPIQAEVLGFTLKGKDAIGRAQTGTGKTAAFLISTITQLLTTPPPKERYMGEPRALIIAPTRELVVQIANDALDLAKYTGLNVMSFVGGMDFDKQLKQLEARYCDILVATPGRLLDFNQRGEVHLDMVEVMVLDEADRMLDMGFIPQVRQIIRQTPPQERTPDPAVLRHLHRRRDESGAAVDHRSGHRRDRAGKRGQRHRRAARLCRVLQRQVPPALQLGRPEQLGAGDGVRQPA